MYYRYAIFLVPSADTPLGDFGNRWLGRNSETGDTFPPLTPIGWSEELTEAAKAVPCRYGFHATLKPPFRLAQRSEEDDLISAVEALANSVSPFRFERFRLQEVQSYLTLVPVPEPKDVSVLASRAVKELDRFRAPPSDAEITRRRKAGLTSRQDALLVEWGYPYALDEFQCHFTLAGPATAIEADGLTAGLAELAAPALGAHLVVDIALCVEPAQGEPFRLLRRFPLNG